MQHEKKLGKIIADGLWDLFVLIKYPKLLLLVIATFLAYGLFQDEGIQSFFHSLGGLGYLSAFIGGMLFAIGFGAPFGVAILATIADDLNIFAAAAVGGLGALLSDYILFKFIRLTFEDEIRRLKESKAFTIFNGLLVRRMPPKWAFYVSVGVAGLVIASPLPDEFGVAMLAGMTTLRGRTFAFISFGLNTIGVLLILALGLAV